MNSETKTRSFIFGIIAILCLVVGKLLDALFGIINNINMGVFVNAFAILAIIFGIKEIAANSGNKKAKVGLIIGIIVTIFKLIGMIKLYSYLTGGFYS